MAEGWGRHLKSDEFEFFSAGVETHGLNWRAVQVMKEAGVDISSHHSQLLADFDLETLDYIVTVCNHAHESCPIVPLGCRMVHKSFDDPPSLAANLSSEEAILANYRRVRDEIKKYVETLPDGLSGGGERYEQDRKQ